MVLISIIINYDNINNQYKIYIDNII
uniref:Uncharacterized protein n=1 Tax=Moumouvirus sp. 'Monve' TaxID=1128131 RepID=H2EDF2_9VIRU|nr:hypothetical protein mv_L220 [Moumouvirus Monve]